MKSTIPISLCFVLKVESFVPFCTYRCALFLQRKLTVTTPPFPITSFYSNSCFSRFSKNIEDGDEEGDDRPGMEDAFRALNSLTSLGAEEASSTEVGSGMTLSTEDAEALIKSNPGENAEAELKVYSDIYDEVQIGDDEIYDDILEEMTGEMTGKSVINDADGIGAALIPDESEQLTAVELSMNTEDLMEKAVKEALEEVQNKSPGNVSLDMDDEDLKTEIKAIFDKGNEKLMKSFALIKEEQNTLSKANAESRSKAMQLEEERLAEAEGSIARLTENVEKEFAEVQKAVAELQAAKEKLDNDPLSKAADLKKAGIVKQSTLVGAVLFSLRSVGDFAMISGPNGASHVMPAVIQGVVALVCAAYFFIA